MSTDSALMPLTIGVGLAVAIAVEKTAKQMLQINKKAEEDAIKLYKGIIALATKEGDVVTRKLFESVLSDEEGHHNTFSTLLEKD